VAAALQPFDWKRGWEDPTASRILVVSPGDSSLAFQLVHRLDSIKWHVMDQNVMTPFRPGPRVKIMNPLESCTALKEFRKHLEGFGTNERGPAVGLVIVRSAMMEFDEQDLNWLYFNSRFNGVILVEVVPALTMVPVNFRRNFSHVAVNCLPWYSKKELRAMYDTVFSTFVTLEDFQTQYENEERYLIADNLAPSGRLTDKVFTM
jgi:hypothetical protein